MPPLQKCLACEVVLPPESPSHRKYCSGRCKARWLKQHRASPDPITAHQCRMCGRTFSISRTQHNKWLCSIQCRRASNAKSVRTFHLRRPHMEPIYRQRTKAKQLPEGNLIRFRRANPDAPRQCESCGEGRVLDVAHKPGHERFGQWRNSENCKWPEMVWVLCPTCHALLDRMNYPHHELGLSL